MIRNYRVAALAFALAVVGCAHQDATAPRAQPATILSGPGTAIVSTAGATVSPAPTFVVKDASGAALSGVPVTIAVSSGGGTLAGAPSRTSNGPTAVGNWTLGTLAGANSLVVTVAGLPPFTITLIGTPDVPFALTVVNGANQSALAGTPLTQPVTFKLVDRYGNAVSNFAVAFRISAGEGFLPSGAVAAQTGADGVVAAPAWTLGKLAVPQQIIASAGNVFATVSAIVRTQFRAEVRFYGPSVDPLYAAAFQRAIDRINAEVVGALAPTVLANFDVAGVCGVTGVAPLSEQIPSLVVFVTVKPIDGPGRIIASSGPCIVRSENQLTVIGIMTFDVADIQAIADRDQLTDVVLHEMQHVLGFGTLWTAVTPPLSINSGTAQTAYTGRLGIQGCVQAGGGSGVCTPSIPLESSGGPGTADGHWRKTIFGAELMTGFISAPGTPMPLSAMTIGSLADLGYQTNAAAADGYRIPSALASSLRALIDAQRATEPREELIQPRFQVSRSGGVKPLR